ncbi:PREDICTED: two-component response regulator-like APRR7 isoform X1 [Lupinus angustifolius]|uniref:two-component response regulator-like APRR7 isoform X1 n=1 Tax=Lupinus angustifolius TaxID=3871 RepID=UPI00092F7534|nr:PREDICTED: two-component response regulator-like APRR7 isoform X1 [Lupinus angustifolius]XP_019427738.1 PREDICTED: two-component response regulator-like APRR7 isoform X1 [Lupinus angustifolius]XP_019427739.1 PREDICTED: two-component response regulator-like APRR7 isoform X1 [Lupinus angustifolius]XP_019427740.1 PREDICTED: two-component response regulator-like APRR7 isoform X1 [Lupinus angustifolius]XP_019427741.1 PREDICTED: two-component response regulator-like APRR7 isoform X1 [Lupinus angus
MTRGALLSVDGDDKDMKEVTQCLQDEKTFNDGVDGEGNSLLGDDGVKCNGVAEEVKVVGQGGTLESSSVQQHIPQPQPQGAIVCWERFLHIRSLKVLLVEYDDSTRHVVTALLRNCSYEVIEAENGLQAWKMLEDLTNHVDLILTEVAMPGLSGIGLLYKIMSHKTRKNVPVIMMSSHDSMGLVFKCLSKGAVDFLVKPIRKNELKNLWQHVWRRCHSSSGSGSESGTQTQKSVKSKSLEKSDNNSGSNDKDDDGSEGLNNGDGSDNGSGTQSSWTKQAVEVDSPEPTFQWDQIAECPDSTCAQVVHSNAEICGNKVVPLAIKESTEQKEQLVKTAGSKHSQAQDVGPSKFNEKISRGLDLNCENQSSEPRCKGISVSDAIPRTFDSHMHSGEFESLDKRLKYSDVENKGTNNDEELPSLELSLKRLRGVKHAGITVQDERNVLRRSDLSAFSRYNAASNTKKSPTGYVGSNSPHDNSLEVTKKDLSHDIQSHSSGNPPNQNSNGASNNIDMGSTTDNNAFTKSAVIRGPAVASTTKCLYQSSAFQPLNNNLICASKQVVLHDTEDKITSNLAPPKVDIHKDSASKDFYHHYESHNCLANNMQHQVPLDHRAELFKKMAAAAPHFGSSNVVEVVVEGNVGNYSVNRSASGSNNGSNGQNGCSTAFNVGGTNIENNNGPAGNSGSGDGSANRVDQNKISQREAALTKFREKRKERCFHKKVRYQSRKKLAEQRPRFRGQFVRQSSNGSASEATDS